ncbi:hypothetical protein [Priestia aryabhattai]|uniref:hypothetical protein n=1 Tax=Priestia aryabhattai TaxID=412384 RepID=UPI003C94B4AE
MRTAVKKKKYIKKQPLRNYIALEDIDFQWSFTEIKLTIALWDEGRSFFFICKCLERHEYEVILLVMELLDRRLIYERGRGVFTSPPTVLDNPMTSRRNMNMHLFEEGHVVFEQKDFLFDEVQAATFDQLWKQGLSLQEIAKALRCKSKKNKIIFLMMDRSLRKKISQMPICIDGRFIEYGDFKESCIG